MNSHVNKKDNDCNTAKSQSTDILDNTNRRGNRYKLNRNTIAWIKFIF